MKVLFTPSIPWMPNILNYTHGSTPNPKKLFEKLESNGIESSIVDPNPKPFNLFAGKDTLLQSIDPLRALQIALRERDSDVIVSVFEGAAFSLSAVKFLLNSYTSLVMWDIGLTNWRLRNKIINFTLPKIDELLVLGCNQIDHINDNYLKCQNISAIGHSIDTEFYAKIPLNDSGYILSVGDDIGRDFQTLIEAKRGIGRELVIKASRHPPDNVDSGIRIIRDRITYSALKELYAGSSLVVVPTFITANACGVSSILEASALGRPLIITENPALKDFIIPNVTCLTVPPNDRAAMADAIKLLLSDRYLCQRLTDNSRDFIEANCSIEVFADRMSSSLKRIVERKRTSRKAI